MGIVVNDGNVVPGAFVLEPAVGAAEGRNAFLDVGKGNLKFSGGCYGSQGIGYVVKPRYVKRDGTDFFFSMNQAEGGAAFLVIGDGISGIVLGS